MRIVDRKTFLALPSGTVFAKFDPHTFGPWEIKCQTSGEDYVVQHLEPYFEGAEGSDDYFNQVLELMAGKPSPPMDFDCAGRDGFFDKDQLFAVCNRDDLQRLIGRLQEALAEGYGGSRDRLLVFPEPSPQPRSHAVLARLWVAGVAVSQVEIERRAATGRRVAFGPFDRDVVLERVTVEADGVVLSATPIAEALPAGQIFNAVVDMVGEP